MFMSMNAKFSQGNQVFKARDTCLPVPDKLEDGFVFLQYAQQSRRWNNNW